MAQELLAIIGISFTLLLACILLRTKQLKYLSLVFFCCALILLEEYLWQTELITHVPYLAETLTPLSFFIPILIYWQYQIIFHSGLSLKLWHGLFFFIGYLNFIPLYTGSTDYKDYYVQHELIDGHLSENNIYIHRSPVLLNERLMDIILIILYTSLLIFLIKNITTQKTKSISKKNRKLFSGWNITMIITVTLVLVCTIIALFLIPENFSFKVIYISGIGVATAYFLLSKSTLLHELKHNSVYEGVSDTEIQSTFQKLNSFLEQEEIYSLNNLTLNRVAEQLSMPPNKLSYIINHHDTTFRHLINKIRIKQATTFLAHPDSQRYSMDGIAEKFGFGSKSTFYKHFKQIHQTTPKQYLSLLEKKYDST